MAEPETPQDIYSYQPNHVAPAIFAALVGTSLLIHTYQNFHYRFWRVTFFMFYAGIVFTIGWVARTISSYNTSSLNLYIVQTVFILAGPPIYSAAEYNILSRLMNYVPMHAPLHPRRVYIFFVYLGAAVESLTAAGGSMIASNPDDASRVRLAGTLISIALVLQGVVELLFISLVALIHHRCKQSKMYPSNIRSLVFTLYGTSILVLARCTYRAIDSFAVDTTTSCPPGSFCHALKSREWPLYVFEATPMLLYTIWLNVMHPARFLPRQRNQYLDIDGKTERLGPGWIDRRSQWQTFVDPFDVKGMLGGRESHVRFWEGGDAEKWEVCEGSFATGTASNVRGKGDGSGQSWPGFGRGGKSGEKGKGKYEVVGREEAK